MKTLTLTDYELKDIKKYQIVKLFFVARILNKCGKDMADKYDLHHWENPFVKSLLIVYLCSLKREIYLLYLSDSPVATFMINCDENVLYFEKLATQPEYSRRGIGSICLNIIEKIAKDNKCKTVRMEVYQPSLHAINFYKNRGYSVVGRKETLKYSELIMEKVL